MATSCRLLAAALLASLSLCRAPPVRAQPSPEQRNLAPARAWFERGLALSESQRWLEAREAYERSLRLQPHVSTYFNLAIVLLKVGEGRAALAALDAFELLTNAAEHAAVIAQAASLREQALSLTGTLKLALIPAEAHLRVDGVELAEPRGAIRRIRLDQGSHTVDVSASAYLTASHVVRIDPGKALELNVMLEPVPSRIVRITDAAAISAAAAPPPLRPSASAKEAEASRRRRKVWLWTVLSLVAAGASAAAVGVAVARRDDAEDSYTGSTGIVFGQE